MLRFVELTGDPNTPVLDEETAKVIGVTNDEEARGLLGPDARFREVNFRPAKGETLLAIKRQALALKAEYAATGLNVAMIEELPEYDSLRAAAVIESWAYGPVSASGFVALPIAAQAHINAAILRHLYPSAATNPFFIQALRRLQQASEPGSLSA